MKNKKDSTNVFRLTLGLFLLFVSCVFSQVKEPYIGYIYPAGGQKGTVFNITVGGQNLNGTKTVYFSKKGISASIINYQGSSGPLNQKQIEELRRRLDEIRLKRAGQTPPKDSTRAETEKPVALPDIPELRDLENKSAKDLARISAKYLNSQNKPKPPIAEEITLSVKIEQDTEPGDCEIRLKTPNGITNPVLFQIGEFPEVTCTSNQYRYELEETMQDTRIFQIPVVLNGRIMPGKTNKFLLQLQKDKDLVFYAEARKIIPYIADAVPGWFQAVLVLYDKNGKEISFVDDCGYDPDPVLIFHVPETGMYTLEIRDALYRGREDFVYRIYAVERSYAQQLFPSGRCGGVKIADGDIPLMPPERVNFQQYKEKEYTKNYVHSIPTPVMISGCINYPGDIDRYRFYGKTGETIVVEVYGRRIGSLIDSMVKIINSKGEVIQKNDDTEDIEYGLITHQSDSYVMAKIRESGYYTVQISDIQNHGGPDYQYFVRIGPPQPDFSLIISPSQINIPTGGIAVATLYAIKKDGWDQDINLRLKGMDGFVLDGAVIPKGKQSIRITIKSPQKYSGQITPVDLEGTSIINGTQVSRIARPAENMMQAFAYTHLVQSEELLIALTQTRFRPVKIEIPSMGLKIPAGGSSKILCALETWFKPSSSLSINFELNNPPSGIKIRDQSFVSDKYILTIEADKKLTGYKDNLIIEVIEEISMPGGQKRKVPVGFLPAIPIEVLENE
ncbi:MAG TPA: hypothetical protein P5025_01310 [Candidatus Ratteibacteria bacterium]|nr:hypothetical protein [Candidatus Ratteibacteria bacterium]